MNIITMPYSAFDVVEYIKKLRNAGVSQEVAEIQGQELEHAMSNILQQAKQESKELFDSKEIATKGDISLVSSEIRESELRLEKEIETVRKEIEIVRKEVAQSTTKTIVWTTGLLGAFSTFFLGILAKGFHWL